MRIYKKTILIFWFLLASFFVKAQQIYKITPNFKSVDFDSYITVYSTLDSINPNFLLKDTVDWKENKVSYGFSNHYYWLKFKVKNLSKNEDEFYIEVKNPHVRFVEFYEPEADNLVLKYNAGRYLPFDARPVDNTRLVFPIKLNYNQEKTFYLKVDKRTSSVSFPTTLWSKNEFAKVSNKINLLNGFLFGGILLVAFYSLVTFAYLKRNLYLWYFAYTISLGFYLFTTAGYSFQYISKNSIFFNSFFRVFTLAFTLAFHAKFVQRLFKTKKNSKELHKYINYIVFGLVTVTFGGALLREFDLISSTNYVKSIYFFSMLLIVSVILVGVYNYHKQKKLAQTYYLAFGAVLFSGVWMILLDYGYFPWGKTDISPIFIGALLEIVILSIALIGEMNGVLNEKNSLREEISKKEQEVVLAFIDGIEKERLRISEELHDDIGSKLSNLNRFITSEDTFSEKARRKLQYIINDVRSLSHKLSPAKSNLLNFKEQIENVVEETLENTEIDFNLLLLEDYPYLTDKQKSNIYRILQEFLHNTIKHSQATFVEIELSKVDNNLILTVEDNGVGFNPLEQKKGLGLINIQRRVNYLKGTLEISPIPNQGTFMIVSFPLI